MLVSGLDGGNIKYIGAGQDSINVRTHEYMLRKEYTNTIYLRYGN